MHELTAAAEILRVVEAQQDAHGFEKVNVIRLRAGAMSGIEPHALEFAFEVAGEGTCAAGARVELDQQPMLLRCRSCRHEMPADHGPAACGRCGSEDLALAGAGGLDIVSLEVD